MPAWEISSPWGRRVRCHSGFGPPADMDPPPPPPIADLDPPTNLSL